MRTIARMTDSSPALLRAWERRHNLLRPWRGPGGHRLYTEDDLQVLLRVRELIDQGRSIGEIAELGRETLLRQGAERMREHVDDAPSKLKLPAPETLDALKHHRDQIVRATLEMDSTAINRALDRSFALFSPEVVVFDVIGPATREIGELWAQGKCSVASEHMATGIFVHRLLKLVESAELVRSEFQPVIVACFPDEYHQLGALMLAYRLCREGLRVNFLGGSLPFEDLEAACGVLKPSAVLLSATRPAIFEAHRQGLLEAAKRVSKEIEFYIGGQGVPEDDPQLSKCGVRTVSTTDDPKESFDLLAEEIRKSAKRAAA
ncbi:MAG: MerR family transcriptional regulator [Bryobacterales bacterium]